ncbi:hypothetical protein E0J16_34055 [Rhizobium pisi]|uniref:hypothetical protein n=1 Tax=Rhizobium pisi TaxID=574561 RepID=UPI00103A87F6|nr:hypothetical protein [Rhizobium pisi]TCA41714.1 hypothetical protein E0J16_34055 [Rhizobium pisi]
MTKTEMLVTFIGWIGGAVSSDIGKFVLGAAGALFIAWFNTRLGIWRDERADKRKREGQTAYSVALLVSALRQYLKNCMAVMEDKGQPDRDQGEYEHWISSVPTPKFAYSDKIEWTLIDPQLMYEVLALSTVEAGHEEAVESAYEHSYGPDNHGWIEERQLRYAELAAIAISHLIEIHKKHPMRFTGDPTAEMKRVSEKLLELEAARKKEAEDNAFWLAEMQKKHPPVPRAGIAGAVAAVVEDEPDAPIRPESEKAPR